MTALLRAPADIGGEADAYAFLEWLRWGENGPQQCPHCGSEKGAWFLDCKDPHGRKSKGGSAARSRRRVWKCRESQCRRQFSVLANTVMHRTKLPIRCWIDVVYALCEEPAGLSARDIAARFEIAEKSAHLMLERIQHALERPEAAGATLASDAPLWVRIASAPRLSPGSRTDANNSGAAAERAAQIKADVARALAEARNDFGPDSLGPAWAGSTSTS